MNPAPISASHCPMPLPIDPKRCRTAAGLAAAALLSACAWLQPPAATSPAPAPAPTPAPAPVPAPPPSPAPSTEPDPAALADAATRQVLAAHERLRQLSAAELAREYLAAAERPLPAGSDTAAAMERALLLMLVNRPQAGDLARAAALLEPHAKTAGPWRAVAQLLLARAQEQRRLEDQIDKQGQQLREQQRRIDQLASQLEALKAIERSLNNPRPGAAPAPAPAPRSAP